jgi:Dolichyl-phosphate-mannose-protein mannosyltransferase
MCKMTLANFLSHLGKQNPRSWPMSGWKGRPVIVKTNFEQVSGRPSAKAAGLVLALLALAICILRIRYIHEPLENDLAIRMAYAARSVAGARYYSDLFVFGPPGALWINEIFLRMFGANDFAVYIMGCTFAVLTLVGVFRCAQLLTDFRGGLIAATTWVLVSGDIFTQANQPNAEVFINAALVWAFVPLLDDRAARSHWSLGAAGLLFFLASSVKHFITLTLVLAALFAMFLPTRESNGGVNYVDEKAMRTWGIVGITAAAAWALLLGWYAATDRLAIVVEALFGSSVRYATQQNSFIDNLILGIRPFGLLPPHQLPFVVLYAFLVASIVRGLFGTRDPRWRIVLGWALGTWVSVWFSGRFYAHYYMLWLPLISIGTGTMFGLTQTIVRRRLARGMRMGVALVLVLVCVRQGLQLARYDAGEAVLAKYGEYMGTVFAEVRRVGKRLAETMPAASSVFEIGAHGLYFYAGRVTTGPFIDSLYGIESAFPIQYRDRMLPFLLASPPTILVVRRSVLNSASDATLRQLLADLLNHVPYVEDTGFQTRVLMVLRRCRSDDRNTGGADGAMGGMASDDSRNGCR